MCQNVFVDQAPSGPVGGAYSNLQGSLNGKEVDGGEKWREKGGTQEREEMERKGDESGLIQLSQRGYTHACCVDRTWRWVLNAVAVTCRWVLTSHVTGNVCC